MARNKKVKIDYQRKTNLIAKYEVYKAEHKKLMKETAVENIS